VRVKQGKKKGKRHQKKSESERGLERPIAAFLSSPSKDVRLWQLQIATFFSPLT
jgi:hypothetical protein